MSKSQHHGKQFERKVIAESFEIPGSIAESFSGTSRFDIPQGLVSVKNPLGYAVSIKAAAQAKNLDNTVVCLADARRMWSWNQPLLLVVGVYKQLGSAKVIHTVYELSFEMTDSEQKALFGELSTDEVAVFHEALKRFEQGSHLLARRFAKGHKQSLASRCGCLTLNPKIDSKGQRRLQCSAKLSDLIASCKNVKVHTADYKNLNLPLVLESSARERKASSPH